MGTSTVQRFTMDEGKAREWLKRAVSIWEGTAEDDNGVEDLPEITSDWDPLAPDCEVDSYSLVRTAVNAEVIGTPDGHDIDFEYNDDSDGGYYRFIVGVGPSLYLASHCTEMRKLGARDTTGLAAAMAILREAVQSANQVLADLDEYVASRA